MPDHLGQAGLGPEGNWRVTRNRGHPDSVGWQGRQIAARRTARHSHPVLIDSLPHVKPRWKEIVHAGQLGAPGLP